MSKVIIRKAKKGDSKTLVDLIDQLGYKISINDMRSNILKYNKS